MITSVIGFMGSWCDKIYKHTYFLRNLIHIQDNTNHIIPTPFLDSKFKVKILNKAVSRTDLIDLN